ncbi:pre-mRNA cleavage and polyadenylation factor I subunit [Scheffersomyces coipomensis]|uniref:pre-mRNA cleavage and polyadenylation factor I subunit n=1 Tax=Scheffersomyces coipomensis TaxID=1788519 RepID=UPI00315D008D
MSGGRKTELLEDYAQSLNELTFNSGPIIENLTTIARENSDVADGIIDTISHRISTAPAEQKLYTLYLLDSICKTVGNPYNILVEDHLANLFTQVYQHSNDQTKKKLVSVLQNWKITKAKGTTLPLFGRSVLSEIEAYLAKSGVKPPPTPATKMIEDINGLIRIFDSKFREIPDPKTKDRLQALHNLRSLLLSGSVQPGDLPTIQSTLNDMSNQINSSQSTPQPNAGYKAETIFHNLIESGLVKVDRDPIPGSKPVYSLQFPKIKYIKPSAIKTPSSSGSSSSTSSILQDILNSNLHNSLHITEFEKVKFEGLVTISNQIANSDLQSFINTNKPTSTELNLLYEAKSSKCSICGKRFTTDSEGSTKKRLHLDWHFRVNKKVSTNKSNVQSRNWYLDDFEWVKFQDDELLEFSTKGDNSSSGSNSTNKTINDNDSKLLDIVANNQYVKVPPRSSNMKNTCNVCHLPVQAVYNDDSGDWVWLKCMKVPGEGKNSRKIVHVDCFNETNKRTPEAELPKSRVKRERV